MYHFCRATKEPFENGTWPLADGINRVCSFDGFGDYNCPTDTWCGALEDKGYDVSGDSPENI